ncbi:HNH endonuclease [Romboutsia sedimentorum]|uniref:HNH endonuclease n=1 Tax=Romboutsia sedimentorum TaxID=1368474 RepID=A0ABT7ECW3_9FIRM|nr:HNH endonuclease [Romboutsia sedimentorum]MDK2563933.1 HNH endonuclease [Romboutsia sedimentorum]
MFHVASINNRLIAETFIENPNKLPLVNHIDGNKLNNKIANLEWTTYSDNVKHAYEENLNTEWKNRRKPVNQFSLEKKFIAEFESARDASRKTGVRLSGIVNVCNKVHKSAGGFYWKWLYSEDIIKRNNSQYNLDDLDNEEWKYINDTNEMYVISNMGRLKSIRWNKLLKPSLDKKSGYMKCGIKCTDKKRYFLMHRLVSIHFIDNPNNYRIVNHKNGDKIDNRVLNLEWVNDSQNQKHQHNKLNLYARNKSADKSKKSVIIFNKEGQLLENFSSTVEASLYLNVYRTYVANHCIGLNSKSVKGYVLCYEQDYENNLKYIDIDEWYEWKKNKYLQHRHK